MGDNVELVIHLPGKDDPIKKECKSTEIVEEVIHSCKQQLINSSESEEEEKQESKLEEKNRQIFDLFLPNKGIWLKRTNTIGYYALLPSDILELAIKPRVLHVCLPHVVKCVTLRYYSGTTVGELRNTIPVKATDFCISPNILSCMRFFVLTGASNKAIISEAQEQQKLNGISLHSCIQSDTDTKLVETAKNEQNRLFNTLFSYGDINYGSIIQEHCENDNIIHIHPLHLISSGINISEGIWLDDDKEIDSYSLSSKDIILLTTNPSVSPLDSSITE